MLTKHEIFAREYVIDFNGAAAARRAGYSPDRARVTALELLDREDVSQLVDQLLEERRKKCGVTQEYVLNELLRTVQTTTGTTKVRALELLGKHLHIFDEHLDINITLARQAEEYAKLPVDEQIKLLEESLKQLKGKA